MGRKILFITTDQQRFDGLGVNGNRFARTPVIDALARSGLNYKRAYNQNTVCMPARSTMLTGQYVRTHGVYANGVPLPEDAPSVAQYLKDKAGYKTALLGKAHFEPNMDFQQRFKENIRQATGDFGPWRGFDRAIHATHVANFFGRPVGHYGRWLKQNHPDHFGDFAALLDATGGGDTGAPETKNNPIPRELYHTDWVADRTIEFLDGLDSEDDWFVWMSFPDPHHPWDPPASEVGRHDWRDMPLPDGHPGSEEKLVKILEQKPAHWLACYEGTWINQEGGPANYRLKNISHDNIREINAKVHVMNELIDEAVGRVMKRIEALGWGADTDVIFTTDHGEMQGDFGMIYKGPFHVDALMRLPMIWRPAPSANMTPAEIDAPVGQVDLAPTFCRIAGIEPAPWMQGQEFPVSRNETRERMICEWDSQFPGYGMHMRSIYRDGFLLTRYEPSTIGAPNGMEKMHEAFKDTPLSAIFEAHSSVAYDGTEGELYHVGNDPHQWENLWDNPAYKGIKSDLIADLYDNLPEAHEPMLEVVGPA